MAAGDLYFVDTNVLLYAVDGRDAGKREAARAWLDRLWREGTGRISWQILHEYYVNAVRKMGLPEETARASVESMTAWRPADMSLGLIQFAWNWMDRAHLSYWDALVVAAAERTGCRYLLSEDFQAGRKLGDLTIVNPFG
jgi:predicted nucleic acid-binding protein